MSDGHVTMSADMVIQNLKAQDAAGGEGIIEVR